MSQKTNMIRTALLLVLLFIVGSMQAQTVKVNVKDSSGEELFGATVQEQGTSNGGMTGLEGSVTLTLSKADNPIVVSYLGMKSQTVQANGRSVIDVVLEDDITMLEDVVVIGYGTVRKKDLTGAVASIDAGKLADIPVANVAEALTGKLSGVNVTTTEGSPDADVKIRVRGGGSLSQDNSPLYIVDGFPAESISDIAPSEIESIDVLKDASSTAIYGARGANGVIIITTKSGKEGNVQVNFNASIGWKKLTKEIKVLDPYNYAYYQYELGNDAYGNYDDLDIWKSVPGSNWQDQIFGRTGVQRQYNANVNGGNKDVKFNVGYAHNEEESIMKGSGYSKDNVNAKLNTDLNKWLSFEFKANLAFTTINGLSGGADTNESNAANGLVANSVRYRPVEPLAADDEDSENSTSIQRNPAQRMDATYKKQQRLRQDYNAALNWKPWENITFRTEFGYGWRDEKSDNAWAADAVQNSRFGFNGQPQLRFVTRDIKRWRNANTVTYDNKKLFGGRDRINVLFGQEWSSQKWTERTNTSVAFPATMTIPEILANAAAGTALPNETDLKARENMFSFFGRVNYTLMDKYLATFTLRADGSSKFGKDHRWGWFPAAAFAWRMSDEDWLKDVSWLDNLKARLSWGTAGNNRIPSGLLQTTYSMAENAGKHPGFDEVNTTMIETGSYLPNPDLKWETTVTRNFGIDFGFFRSRINGSLEFYWNTTKDLLMQVEIPSQSGYTYQYRNFGQTSNKGVELNVNTYIVDKKNFTLNANFNIAWNTNKIDKLNMDNPWQSSNFAGSTFAAYEDFKVAEGGRLGEIWGYKTNGFYTAYDPVTNPNGELVLSGQNWVLREGIVDNSYNMTALKPGAIKYQLDADGNPLKQKLGNTIPKVTGGFGIDGTVGNFDFNMFFSYSLGNKIVNGTKLANSFYTGSARNYNIVNDFALGKRFTGVDPETGYNLSNPTNAMLNYYGSSEALIARLIDINQGATTWNPATMNRMHINDWAVEDASFLRMQTLTVGYTLPKAWVKKAWLSNVRLYFTAYNLFCITGYDGYDPEVDTSSKRNPMCPGIDYAAYPKSRTFVGGINVTF